MLARIDYTHLRLALSPTPGRTDQRCVHCAHCEGLHALSVGDPLYGNEPAQRLMLHAESISFEHPLTGKKICLEEMISI